MLRNYFLVAVRNLLRNPAISFIHISGFGLGLAAFLFTMQVVISEHSFDSFHKNGDRIYKITGEYKFLRGETFKISGIEPAMAPLLKSAVPEITHAARYIGQLMEEPYCVLNYVDANGDSKSFNELAARYVDEDFLKIFQFEIIQGNKTPLTNSTGMVMTRSCAKKYFGDENPIGKVIELTTGSTESNKTKFTFQVETILEDIPSNSSLQFEILLPFRAFEDNYKTDVRNNWSWHASFHTFIETRNKIVDLPGLESKIYNTVPESIRDNWISTGAKNVKYRLLKLSDIHFSPGILQDFYLNRLKITSNSFLLMLTLIGFAVLIIAEMNYISLTTAKALRKIKEVSIRRIVGAGKKQLAVQFLLDAWLHVLIGLGFALTLLQIAKTHLAQWLSVSIDTPDWNYLSIFFIVIFTTSVMLMGVVPAYYLSRVVPAYALKGKVSSASNGGVLRKCLVIFQFCSSVVLICVTYVIVSQLTFMRSKDTGFSTNQRIAIRTIGTEDFDFKKFRQFKERIENVKNVIASSAATDIPGFYGRGGPLWSTPDKPEESSFLGLAQPCVELDFMKTLNIPLIAGRDFTRDRLSGEREALINETAVRYIGYDTPSEAVGKSLYFHWQEEKREVKIIGVVGDVHFDSPGTELDPTVFTLANSTHPYPRYRHYLVHLNADGIHETIGTVKKVWQEIFHDAPFEYFFLDEGFQQLFDQEEKMQAVATLSSVLTILIACMGLAGLVAFSMTQRIKEIGIRKTLGASVSRIYMMLSGDFAKLILISIALAIPIAWVVVSKFLEKYHNRIELSLWVFLAPCLLLLLIAIATMSYQTVKAAKSNPVDALKYE